MRQRPRVIRRHSAPSTAVIAEATHGLLLSGGIASVVVAVLLSFLAKPDATLWPDRSTLSSLVCVFTVPLVAGLTAIVTGARMGGMSQVAATSPAGRYFPAQVVWFAAVVWAMLVAVAQVVAPIGARSPSGASFTWMSALPWWQTGVSVVAGVSLGVLAGCRWRVWSVGPILAAVTFAWTYMSTYLPGRWNVLAPFDNSTFYQPWLEPAPGIIFAHMGAALAVTSCCWAVLHPRSLVRRWLMCTSVLLVAASMAGLATVHPQRARPRALNGSPACSTDHGIRFCGWPSTAAAVPRIAAALSKVNSVVDGQWSIQTAFAMTDLPATIEGHRIDITMPATDETVQVDAMYAMLPTCTRVPEGQQTQSELMGWMNARLGLDPAPDSPYIALIRSTPAKQHRWVRQELAKGGCQ